jgi:hypothetical protein
VTVALFCGPTLARQDVLRAIDADIRPPAARGDILRAALKTPTAIGLVDGYFDRVPSVWHKEILWAMSEGIHVFGAASMGALRSAELSDFGMEGVGRIFEAYRTGELQDDDEVAVTHASEEEDYRALSEAMVNVRATMRAACQSGIINDATRGALEAIAKALPYPDRCYPTVFRLAECAQLPLAEMAMLRDWIPSGRVDQKREDALLMLQRMAECGRAGWPPKKVGYTFAHTDAWEALRREVTAEVSCAGADEAGGTLKRDLGDELRATGAFGRTYDGALARALCLEEARRSRIEMNARAIEAGFASAGAVRPVARNAGPRRGRYRSVLSTRGDGSQDADCSRDRLASAADRSPSRDR